VKKEPDKKEECDVLPDDLLRDIALLKGSAIPRKAVAIPDSILYPVSAAIAAEELRKEKEALKNPTPGLEIPRHGIFIGTWQPQGLSQKFNAFAANEDLPKDSYSQTYDDIIKYLAGLEGWHGHNGTNYATDKELYEALKNESYDGGWFIPPRELLTGNDAKGKRIQLNNLCDHKAKGALSGTFHKAFPKASGMWYWSSTQNSKKPHDIWSVNFENGNEFSWYKRGAMLNCRPVRLELVQTV